MPDVEIRLGGRTFNLRPTFGAMREIEAQCKSSCATLLQLLARHELHASEMAWIVYHGMKEAGSDEGADPEGIGNRLFSEGIGNTGLRSAIAEYLGELLYAPDSAKKKAAGEWFAMNEEVTSRMFSLPRTPSDGDPRNSGEQHPESSGQSSKPSVKNPSG